MRAIPYSDSLNFSETAILEYQFTKPGRRVLQSLLLPKMPSKYLGIIPIVWGALYPQGNFSYLNGPGPPSDIAESSWAQTTTETSTGNHLCTMSLKAKAVERQIAVPSLCHPSGSNHGKSHQNLLLWENKSERFNLNGVKTIFSPPSKYTITAANLG